MKTTKILLAAAALATFTLASRAATGDLYLSPHTVGDEPSHMVSEINNDPNLITNQDKSAPPRMLEQQPKVTSGKNDDPNLVAQTQKANGAPRSLDSQNPASFQIAPVK